MDAISRRPSIGIMGGTFDPIHHGHLVAASEVAHHFELDEVVFVPTGRPYQKSEREVSAPEDRYLMTVIATASNPRFSVSRVASMHLYLHWASALPCRIVVDFADTVTYSLEHTVRNNE